MIKVPILIQALFFLLPSSSFSSGFFSNIFFNTSELASYTLAPGFGGCLGVYSLPLSSNSTQPMRRAEPIMYSERSSLSWLAFSTYSGLIPLTSKAGLPIVDDSTIASTCLTLTPSISSSGYSTITYSPTRGGRLAVNIIFECVVSPMIRPSSFKAIQPTPHDQ